MMFFFSKPGVMGERCEGWCTFLLNEERFRTLSNPQNHKVDLIQLPPGNIHKWRLFPMWSRPACLGGVALLEIPNLFHFHPKRMPIIKNPQDPCIWYIYPQKQRCRPRVSSLDFWNFRVYGSEVLSFRLGFGVTLPKFNSSPLKVYLPNRKIRKVVFQPPFFRGELLNFGGVGF